MCLRGDLSQLPTKVPARSSDVAIRSQSPHYWPRAQSVDRKHAGLHTKRGPRPHAGGRRARPPVIGPPGRRRWPAPGLTAERCGRQQRQRALWDVEQISSRCRDQAQRCAVYHLTLYNWAHTSTKWRWLRRQRQGGQSLLGQREDVPPHLYRLPFSADTLWSKPDKPTHLLRSGFCLRVLLIACNTMVIGRVGVCASGATPLRRSHHPAPALPLRLPSPPPC